MTITLYTDFESLVSFQKEVNYKGNSRKRKGFFKEKRKKPLWQCYFMNFKNIAKKYELCHKELYVDIKWCKSVAFSSGRIKKM